MKMSLPSGFVRFRRLNEVPRKERSGRTLATVALIWLGGCGQGTVEVPNYDQWAEESIRAFEERQLNPSSEGCPYAIGIPDAPTPGYVALTFDDGPRAETTGVILDVLREFNAPATFFVVGASASGQAELLDRIVAEGHHLGNHTYNHVNTHTVTLEAFGDQVRWTQQELADHDSGVPFFRFPYGNSTCAAQSLVGQRGYDWVGWDIDSCDWAFAVNRGQICTRDANFAGQADFVPWVVKTIEEQGGGVALFHDVHSLTRDRLREILATLVDRGYAFVDLYSVLYPRLNRHHLPAPTAECAPGDQREAGTCGFCGTSWQTCNEYGLWDPRLVECVDAGECNPGETRAETNEVCDSSCQWGRACTPDYESCSPLDAAACCSERCCDCGRAFRGCEVHLCADPELRCRVACMDACL